MGFHLIDYKLSNVLLNNLWKCRHIRPTYIITWVEVSWPII